MDENVLCMLILSLKRYGTLDEKLRSTFRSHQCIPQSFYLKRLVLLYLDVPSLGNICGCHKHARIVSIPARKRSFGTLNSENHSSNSTVAVI